jgi:hypothetical protein
MSADDPALAALWLSELGAHVPEHRDGQAPPPLQRFGLDLSPADRAELHERRMAGEGRRARAYRARSDPPRGRA